MTQQSQKKITYGALQESWETDGGCRVGGTLGRPGYRRARCGGETCLESWFDIQRAGIGSLAYEDNEAHVGARPTLPPCLAWSGKAYDVHYSPCCPTHEE
jgi:hypothetical protein